MNDERARIDRLEIRLTEQEAVIDELNATITAQWRTIESLKRQLQKLAEQVEEASARSATGGSERPPHY